MRIAAAVLLAWRSLQNRPRRTFILLLGYGLGVAVMIALLAVGDALLWQAQDRDVVSGGDVVVLPEGIDPEVLKVGALPAMFFSIPNARFVARQILLGPRYTGRVAAVSPEIVDKLVYLRTDRGVFTARAAGALPAASRDARSSLHVSHPAWRDTSRDRAWLNPTPAALLAEIDRFHAPDAGVAGKSWAEWWYFNFIDRSGLYGYVSFIADRDRRVLVSVTIRFPGGRTLRWNETHTATTLPLDGRHYRAGPHSIDLEKGAYEIKLNRPAFRAALRVTPTPGLHFPPVEWTAGTLRSGYVVPALSASVSGRIDVDGREIAISGRAYHDHNWGVWEADGTPVTWEWGTAATRDFALLSGLVRHRSLGQDDMFVSLYSVVQGRAGVLSLLRGTQPLLDQWQSGMMVTGQRLRVPGRLRYQAANDAGDRVTVTIDVRDVLATQAGTRAFLQMRGRYKIQGIVAGRSIRVQADGFAETFIPRPR